MSSDIEELYGVETKCINKAVKNNTDKFLDGYIIELNISMKNEPVENFDRFKSFRSLNY